MLSNSISYCMSCLIFKDCLDVYFQLLSRLLRSKNPEDLQAANRLIKNMVKQVGMAVLG